MRPNARVRGFALKQRLEEAQSELDELRNYIRSAG